MSRAPLQGKKKPWQILSWRPALWVVTTTMQWVREPGFPSLSSWMVWRKHQRRDWVLSTLMCKVKGWVQKKTGDKLKGSKWSLEVRIAVHRVG